MANPAARYRTITVVDDATNPVPDLPTKIKGATGDAVVWFVLNESLDTAVVKIKDFKKKPGGQAINAVDFIVQSVSVDPGEEGIIVAEIVYLPSGSTGTIQSTKYTVEARLQGNPKVVYDPDLDIEKP